MFHLSSDTCLVPEFDGIFLGPTLAKSLVQLGKQALVPFTVHVPMLVTTVMGEPLWISANRAHGFPFMSVSDNLPASCERHPMPG